jgi:cellulose synthase/poly-beta-1,6-N-acetylglucosamine synthase-like glycosyltransferase
MTTETHAPRVDVVVPVFNELGLLAGKLENLARLEYPRERMTVWVVDGCSTDGTAESVRTWAKGHPGLEVRFLRAAASGKPEQLSAAFEATTSEWVLVTDADARLEPDALKAMVAAVLEDPSVALVGAPVEPAQAHRLDQAHWKIVNWFRYLEARAGCVGLVVGPAYLVRRDLLAPFPAGTIMDDVHLCCRAALAGARIAIVPTVVTELRAPITIAELARHKMRKALGYLREVLHFLPSVGRMRGPARSAYLWRGALLLGIPLITVAAVALLAASASGHGLLIGAGVLAAGLMLSSSRLAPVSTLAAIASLPFAGPILLTVAFLSYPFVRQTARYPKVTAFRGEDP